MCQVKIYLFVFAKYYTSLDISWGVAKRLMVTLGGIFRLLPEQ